jgi:hypothetical protein
LRCVIKYKKASVVYDSRSLFQPRRLAFGFDAELNPLGRLGAVGQFDRHAGLGLPGLQAGHRGIQFGGLGL